MSIFAPTNNSMQRRGAGFATAQENARRAMEEQAARAADPVEQAVRYIRSRGRVIFKASVQGGPDDRWKHAGQLLDAAGVLALEQSIRGLPWRQSRYRRPNPRPAPSLFADQPASKPPARKAPTTKEKTMGRHLKPETSEQANCRERGTTPAKVKADLTALRDLLGAGGAADRLGVGKSTVGNIIGGHASVGPTILASLYGDSGCTLKPGLAALLDAASPAEKPPAADEPVFEPEFTTATEMVRAPSTDSMAPVADAKADAEQLGVAVIIAAAEAQSLPQPANLAKLNVADLLGNAERRRAELKAALADIDNQIDAVLKLAGGAA